MTKDDFDKLLENYFKSLAWYPGFTKFALPLILESPDDSNLVL